MLMYLALQLYPDGKFVTGKRFVRNKNLVLIGESGSHIYSSNGMKHHSVAQDEREFAGYANAHDLTEIGAHPLRELELLRDWLNRHIRFGFRKPGKPGEGVYFGSDFVVLRFDAHNGLQMHSLCYTGLGYKTPSGRTMFEEYRMLFEELSHFSQVVDCCSDCPERFGTDPRLEQESRALASVARDYGIVTYSMSSVWGSIRPFCNGMESGGERVNLWHHADYPEQKRLQHIWDRLIKRLSYIALANSFGEFSGRSHPLDAPFPEPSAPVASGQAASAAAAAVLFTVDDFIEQVKGEVFETSVEPRFVSDVNLGQCRL